MRMKLRIRNAVDNTEISAEVEDSDSVNDVLIFASEYWKEQNYALVMKIGNRLIQPNLLISETGLADGDTVVIVPDPQGG